MVHCVLGKICKVGLCLHVNVFIIQRSLLCIALIVAHYTLYKLDKSVFIDARYTASRSFSSLLIGLPFSCQVRHFQVLHFSVPPNESLNLNLARIRFYAMFIRLVRRRETHGRKSTYSITRR